MKSFAFALAFVLAPYAAQADTIDQQNTSYTGHFDFTGTSVGESFVPSLSSINFASFALYGTGTTQLSLLSGAGATGTVLGTANSVTLTSTPTVYTFNFGKTISLTPGATYELLLSGAPELSLIGSVSNPYAKGTMYVGGVSQPTADLAFAEGVTVTPEPSSLLLLGTGALGLAGLVRRRMRKA